MAAPATFDEFLDLVRKSGVADEPRLDAYLQQLQAGPPLPDELGKVAGLFVRDGLLTHFQAEQLLGGKWRRFFLGKYKVLERLGAGGMGMVYLCEHRLMRRRVAVKVLPASRAEDPASLARFYREARAVAALDHVNIVRAYDIDQEEKLHFLVMEYIDGANLQEVVKRNGPVEIRRAAHYIRQAAQGLEHAYRAAGIIHRDIKPGNILVDRTGVVKILDLGLARFFQDEDSVITRKYDDNVLGTADYLAPEQALDSHAVDIRADIYGLGGTFYFCLTGHSPFKEGSIAQKLIWHQTRQPKPIQEIRPEIPAALAAVIAKMLAKDPAQRYQSPAAVVEALAEWTRESVAPPPEREMPRLSPAAKAAGNLSEIRSNVGSGSAPSAPRRPLRSAVALRSASPTPLPSPATTTAASRSPEGPPERLPPADEAPFVQPDMNHISWEQFALETSEFTARADTVPGSGRRILARPSRRRYALASVLAAVVLGFLLLGGWAMMPSGPASIPGPMLPSPRGPATLQVTRTATGPGCFPTVHEALLHARSGDRIVVRDDQLEEALLLDEGKWGHGVTIEAGNAAKRVRWICPVNLRSGKFIAISYVGGLHLRGFEFDGQGRVADLIALSGNCPGLTLEDVHLRGSTRAAIVFWNCAGSREAPVSLVRVRVTTSQPAPSALEFHARSTVAPARNETIRILDSRFEGPFQAAIRLVGSVRDLEVRGNRFFGATDAILYQTASPRSALGLRLESNAFCTGATGIRFQALPLSDKDNQVVVENNLFLRLGSLARSDEKPSPGGVKEWFRTAGNVRDALSGDGNLLLDAPVQPFSLAINPADDATFLRYPKTDPLARAGLKGGPVGVAPAE